MKWYGKLYIGILLAILYIPIFFLMFYSFNSAGNMIHFEHFTLEHYQSLFQNDHLMSVIFNTIAVALLAASISTVIGTFGAIAIYYLRIIRRCHRCIILNYVYNDWPFYWSWFRILDSSNISYCILHTYSCDYRLTTTV